MRTPGEALARITDLLTQALGDKSVGMDTRCLMLQAQTIAAIHASRAIRQETREALAEHVQAGGMVQ